MFKLLFRAPVPLLLLAAGGGAALAKGVDYAYGRFRLVQAARRAARAGGEAGPQPPEPGPSVRARPGAKRAAEAASA